MYYSLNFQAKTFYGGGGRHKALSPPPGHLPGLLLPDWNY